MLVTFFLPNVARVGVVAVRGATGKNRGWTVVEYIVDGWIEALDSLTNVFSERPIDRWKEKVAPLLFFPLLGLFRLHPPTNQPGSGRRRETVSSFHSCTCHFCVLFRVDECGHAIGKRRRRFSRLPCRVPPGLKLQKWLCWYYRVPCIFQLGSVFFKTLPIFFF